MADQKVDIVLRMLPKDWSPNRERVQAAIDIGINIPNVLLWLKDLTTTNAPQTQGKLVRGGTAFCCLGRACMVAMEFGRIPLALSPSGEWFEPSRTAVRTWGTRVWDAVLPEPVSAWLGFGRLYQPESPRMLRRNIVRAATDLKPDFEPTSADMMNDNRRWDFNRIAQAITWWLGLNEDLATEFEPEYTRLDFDFNSQYKALWYSLAVDDPKKAP
jgi:hypothetical protein